MQEASHHGHVIREYRESQAGITQDELARQVGKSRRTIVSIEQSARIHDLKLRRTLAWVLHIPPELLGLEDISLPQVAVITAVDVHIEELTRLLHKSSARDRNSLLTLLSHNYQLKGMIARDQLDFQTAERCFKQASLLAQEAECVELNALTMARQAVMNMWLDRLDEANQLYETAREITRRSPPGLRAFLATGHAEVQGLLGDQCCLVSLTEARVLLRRVDPEDDHLLLLLSTRCSEQSINDGWSQCHTFIGKPDVAIESYDKLEHSLDLSMTRMRARLYTQYAEALYAGRDMSCCFYAAEGLKLARSVGSQYNVQRVKKLAAKLRSRFPGDDRVKELLRAL